MTVRTIAVNLTAADEGADHFNCEATITEEGVIQVLHHHIRTVEITENSREESPDPVIAFLRSRALADGAATFADLKTAAETGSFEIP